MRRSRELTPDEGRLEVCLARRLGVKQAHILDFDETEVNDGRLINAQILCQTHNQFNAIFAKLLQHRCRLRYVQFIQQTEHLHISYVEVDRTRPPKER